MIELFQKIPTQADFAKSEEMEYGAASQHKSVAAHRRDLSFGPN